MFSAGAGFFRHQTGGHAVAAESLRILVVEGDKASAAALKRLLHRDGHRVTVACTKTDAVVAAARAGAIDLLFCDVVLPDGNGPDLLRVLNDRRGGGPRHAVAVTGDGDDGRMEECHRAGFSQFLPKPVPYEQVLAAVEAARRAATSLAE
jgi:CheY-like chemotaxis protein